MGLDDYERKELAKLRTVMKAAGENGANDSIVIETTGHDPHARVTIKAYVFEKFIKERL